MENSDNRHAGKLEEVEITPDMIKAGARKVEGYDPEYVTAEDIAEAVYRAMAFLAGAAPQSQERDC